MKFKVALTIAICFGAIAAAQQPNTFPQPTAAKEVMVTAIPGVIATGAKWKLVWQGPDNADGIIGTKDGGLLFAQEQPSTVGMLDPSDRFSIFVRDTHGTGALAYDNKGRLIGAERTCSDPGGRPAECKEAAELVVLHPTRLILASKFGDKTFAYGRSRGRFQRWRVFHRRCRNVFRQSRRQSEPRCGEGSANERDGAEPG